MVTAHRVIFTLIYVLTSLPVRAKEKPVWTHAEHLQGEVSLVWAGVTDLVVAVNTIV